MTGIQFGMLMFGFMLLLMALRVHIAIAMIITGIIGYATLAGWSPLLAHLKTNVYARYSNYELSVIPLYLLMGTFAARGGLSKSLFDVAAAFIGHWRGGLAMSAVGACAGFGAICGSSLATAATMGRVALPELRRYNYSPRLATGTLAAGGTLGILIPPSVPLVIYAMLAEQNIAKLYAAAIIPGILAAIGYMITIAIVTRLQPLAGPAGQRIGWAQRWRAVINVWPVAGIFFLVIGGIYLGWFTPTEAAAVGALLAGLTAFLRGGLRAKQFFECLLSTAESTAMIFFILLGADVLNSFLALSQMPMELSTWVQGLGVSPFLVMLTIIAVYIVLGCVMDSLSMLLLTIPILLPVVLGLDFWGLDTASKAIWFGVLALVVVEIGLIHPPVGMNIYIINSIAKDVPMIETVKGVLPFLASDAVRVLLLIIFPTISLWLVRQMG
ncbi:MAG: TRAP transporter large permease [Burkholderiales bacterium]